MKKRIGILTFHHSYNCGSMMQAYALQTTICQMGHEAKIINFSNEGQQRLYGVMFPPTSIKNIIKNIILLPHKIEIINNFDAYNCFINDKFDLDGPVRSDALALSDYKFDIIISGSDQVWNVTIEDADDAYFLPWVHRAKKVAYAPSFGAKNPAKYASNPYRYKKYLEDFDNLSVREKNGKRWIKELIGRDVPVLLDPTLLLDAGDYECLEESVPGLPDRYLFYYSPSYSANINRLVEQVSKRYNLPVVAFNAKNFYVKGMNITSSFELPFIESPATYLFLIKHASVVFTTSFHGTIFSTIYRKPFWTVKNGGMFGDDDRVFTLASTLGIEGRLCSAAFDQNIDYLSNPDWKAYEHALVSERERSHAWLTRALG